MGKKFLCFLSVVFFLVGCSHQEKKSQSHAPKVGFIKITGYGKTPVKRRNLSSNESIPGAEDFYNALKEFKLAFGKEYPIGFQVIRHNSGQVDGKPIWDRPGHLERTVYLKQNKFGVFYLRSTDKGPNQFTLEDVYSMEEYSKDDLMHLFNTQFKEIKKMAPTRFWIVREEDGRICETRIDLKKSSAVSNDETCKDASGNVVYKDNFLSITPINVSDYKRELKSTKLFVLPAALNHICVNLMTNKGNEGDLDNSKLKCESSVVDQVEKDWSFILK